VCICQGIVCAYAKELCVHMHAYAGFPDRKGKGLLFCTSVRRYNFLSFLFGIRALAAYMRYICTYANMALAYATASIHTNHFRVILERKIHVQTNTPIYLFGEL